MTPTPILQPYIDSTMRSCFVSCEHKFWLEFALGLRPPGISIDLHAGACFAKAMEHIGKAVHTEKRPLESALITAHAEFMVEWGDFVSTKDTPKTRERVWEAIEDYFATYPPLTDHVQPYLVDGFPTFEFAFAIPLDIEGFPMHPVSGDPFLYSGRFDMLGQWGGKPIIRDEKTTTSVGAAWAEQWQLRAQLIGYVWACRQMGIPIDTVCIRGIGILKTKFHQVEAMPTFSQWEIERWLETLRRDMHRLVNAWNDGYFNYNLGETCNAYGGCQFREPCKGRDEARWYDRYSVHRWNPLQRNPIEGDPSCLPAPANQTSLMPTVRPFTLET